MQMAKLKIWNFVYSLISLALFSVFRISVAEDGARLIVKPEDTVVELNTKINFFCRADGNPMPGITWKRNGKSISQARYVPETLLNGLSTLRIEPVKEKDNDSEITCTADNGRGPPMNASSKLFVLKSEDLPIGFPSVIEDPKLRAVEKGSSASMTCNVRGSPTPDVIWLKDLMPVDMTNPRYSIATLGNPGTLLIQQSEEIDEGKYECVARNAKGVAQSRSAHLYVKTRRVPPHFSIPPRRIYQVMPGGSVNMSCVAVGHPMPRVLWRRVQTNEYLEPPDTAPVGRNVLVLTNVQKTENFSCVAFSNLGNINSEVTVEVKALPDPPENLKVTNVSARSVALSWTTPSTTIDGIRQYVVRYRPKYSEGDGFLESEPLTSSVASISGLEPYTEYELSVLTVGEVGRGLPSRPVETTTFEAPPDKAPKNVQSRPLSTSTVLVQWEPPEKPNGQITGYKIYYSDKASDPYTIWPTKDVLEGKMAQISDLLPDMMYSIRVQARNSAGYSPLSDTVLVYTKAGIPGQPTNVKATAIGPSQVSVSWEPPLHPDVKNYVIRYNMSSNDHDNVEVPGTVNEYKIASLKPNTDYSFQVVAKSQRGEGAPSKFVTIRTSASVPSGFPEGVVVEALSSSAVRVIWDPPTKSSHNGLIRTYRISVAKKNAEDDEEDEEDGGASKSAAMLYEHSAEKQRSFVVENLLPYSTYKVSVAAGTSVGFGPDSPPVEVTTQSDVPGPPRNVHAELLNATTVKLNWSEPLEKNGPLSGYFVDIDELNEQNQFVSDRPMRTKSTKTEVVLYNLKPNTRFGARVSAYNRKGDGVPSKSKIFRTDKLRPSAPKNVQIEFLVDQSTSDSVKVRVKWEAPDNLLKTGPKSFLLKYKLKESSRFDREILVNDALQQDVDALKYGRTYEFRVWSMYEGEVSEKEGWNTMTTPVGIPEDAPVNVRYEFNNNNNNALLFTWDPPLLEFRNGEITRYETSLISSVEDPVTREVSQQEASFQGINPNAKYEFKVRAGTTKGLGPWSNITVVEHSLPEHWLIDVVELTALSDTEAGVRWNQIMDPKVQGYRVSYTNKPSMSHWTNEDILNQSVTTRLVTHLEPRATYQFCVKALLENKKMGECGLYKTLELKPRVVVKDLNVKLLDDMHTALLSWQYEGPRPMKFKVEYDFHKQYLTEQGKMHDPLRYTHPFTPVEETHLEITNLRNNSNYTFKVSVIYDGKTYWPINVTLKTEVGPPPWFHAPEVIDDKTVKNVVKLKINAAAEENGEIKLYWLVVAYSNYMNNVTETIRTEDLLAENDIYIAASFSQSELWGAGGPFTSKDQIFLVGDGRNSTDKFFAGGHHNRLLNSSRRYKAFVRAFVGDPSNKTNFKSSLWSKDFGLHTQPAAVIALSDSSFGIIGIVVSVIVVAVILGGIGIFVMNINKKKRLPTKHGSISKVALGPLGGPTETSKLLTAGGEYANMPPPINGNVKPYESVTADGVYGSYLDQIDMKRLNYPTPPMGSSTGVGPHPPIPIIEFAAHIERLKANDNLAFSQEYESIETGQQFTWDHSNKEFNKSKNRYANVIAYDHSRVILSTADNVPGSDYVNANYIDGYRKPKAYIATQGPLPETFADFWRMCWEENTSTIVMLTKLEERTRIKCDQYWPSRGQMTYGVVQVVAKETHEFAHYTLRSFDVFRIGCNDLREIKQLQFTAWPDHGVPDHPTPFLMFLKRVKTVNPSEAGPIVVHCSAGVGRTGAFIVIDTMMDRLRYENTVDIYGCVASIRSQRNYMVQTEDQYVFIHDAVLDAVHSGCTEVPVNKLYTHIQKLIQVNPMDNASNMELEFRILAGLKMLNVRFTAASLPCNKQKNRLVNILPFDSTRVYLSPLGADADGSDYINASFIDGYRKRKAYIATQGPLPNTVEDFWRMLWEMNSSIIVMLTKLKEMGREVCEKCHRYKPVLDAPSTTNSNYSTELPVVEKCCQYWPEQQPERYGTLLVEPIAEYNMPQYVLREFRLTDTRDGQSRTIRHFHYIEWPEQGVPKAGEYFIEFIGQVHKTKEQFGQEGPITVHCSAGVGRTGVFIALSIILERMRYEGVVDVFTTVKLLRTQRPNMVQSEDQYHFCYRAALEYLGSFDHYALQTYE